MKMKAHLRVMAVLAVSTAAHAQTVTWSGGAFASWFTNSNWTPAQVPTNGPGLHYTVIVPGSVGVSYDGGRSGTIDALSLGSQAALRLTGGSQLEVFGPSILRGAIDAQGGSIFRALTNQTVLSDYPQLFASDGG